MFLYIHERFRKLGIATFYCPSLQPHKFIYFWCFFGSESRKALGRRGKRLWVEERVLKVPLKSKSISSGSKRCYSFDYSAGSALGRWAEAAARREGTGGLRRLAVAAQSMLHLKIDWSVILEPRFIWLRAISHLSVYGGYKLRFLNRLSSHL